MEEEENKKQVKEQPKESTTEERGTINAGGIGLKFGGPALFGSGKETENTKSKKSPWHM